MHSAIISASPLYAIFPRALECESTMEIEVLCINGYEIRLKKYLHLYKFFKFDWHSSLLRIGI